MRALPDWLIYIVAIAVFVMLLFAFDRGQRSNAPGALPGETSAGSFLPPPSLYDPEVLVDVGEVSSGLGSAFAISADGWWLTARHVVDSCERVGIVVSRGAAAPALEIKPAQFADLALIKTDFAPSALALDLSERRFRIGQPAFHFGFPQGRPGEAVSRLIGRENLVAHGRYTLQQGVLVWAETGRTGNISGSLAGINGGPAIAASGHVIGVTIAQSTRQGRLYTATPSSISDLLRVEQVEAGGEPTGRLNGDNYGRQGDELRRALAVAQVVCIAADAKPAQ